jgi:histidyl-tRNA synthetase
MSNKLSTDSYKGVRDFFPEDLRLRKHIFEVMRKTAESYGYVEYDASILEPAELYKAKSGEEIVNDQTYTFTDRGGREVTLRPEMTPTVARMVAARRRDLGYPLRWYSIPNLFRYENPQRGRLREHYQLNVDIFGVADISADIEVIQVANSVMRAFGATDKDFSILINSRKLLLSLFEKFILTPEQIHTISKLIDKKDKVSADVFEDSISTIFENRTDEFISLLSLPGKLLEFLGPDNESVKKIIKLIEELGKLEINNVVFSPTLMRGFDYYTDVVFEIFDTNSENRRSLFGGGRYDNLLELFGGDTVPAVGFGMGDVTLTDFLSTHNLLPKTKTETDAILATIGEVDQGEIILLGDRLRQKGLRLAINTITKKPADAIKSALKQGVNWMIFVGPDELEKKIYTLKNLSTEETFSISEEEIVTKIKS